MVTISHLFEKFKLFKLKKKYAINGQLPITLDFYNKLLLLFRYSPIQALDNYLYHMSGRKIVLYTKDIYELKSLLTILNNAMLEDKSINSNKRLYDGSMSDVKEHFIHSYLHLSRNDDTSSQQRLLTDCLDLVIQCIATLEIRKNNHSPTYMYYEQRVILLATDFVDIYYALMNFYLES